MGLLDKINPIKIGKKVVGAVKKQISKVAKGVKKAVNVVKKIQKKTFKGVKELTRNKYVRLGLMITAAVMLPGAIAALPALSGLGVTAAAVATGAISGAVMGAGGVVMAGGSFKDALKAGAFGAATGAAFAGIGSKIKQAQAAKVGGESLDLTQGKLDAMGADGTLDASAYGDNFAENLADYQEMREITGTGQISTDVTSPADVSAAIADSGLPATPRGTLTDMSPVTAPDTVFVDEVGAAFAKTADGFKPISSLNNYVMPKIDVDTSGITDFTKEIASVDSLTTSDSIKNIVTENVDLIPSVAPELSYGEKITQGIKDSFSAEKVVDGVMDFGTSIGGSLAMGAIQGDAPLQSGVPSQTLSGVGAGMAYQPFQAALVAADINPLAAYENLTYGSGDINAAGGELFRQQILPIQVG
tara:strand:+ start:832 stop:2079 length:1248 start_codon:yes stop_codon:yes gene_type:complete